MSDELPEAPGGRTDPGPEPVPRWVVPSVAGLVVVSLVFIAWLVTRPDGGSPGRYEAHGVSFEYPAGWEVLPEQEPFVPGGAPAPSFVVQLGYRPPVDTVYVAGYRLADVGGAGSLQERMDRVVEDFAGFAGLQVLERPQPVDHARLQAHQALVAGAVDGREFRSLLYLLTDGETLWSISCQSSDRHREALEDGCRLVFRTFSQA